MVPLLKLPHIFILGICVVSMYSAVGSSNEPECFKLLLIQSDDEVSILDAAEIQSISEEIKSRFSPDDFVYLTIGRSLTPIAAYFEIIGIHVTQMPYSLKAVHPDKNVEAKARHELMQAYLPQRNTLDGKRVLVLDYVSAGTTLKTALGDIKAFYGDKVEVLALGLLETFKSPRHRVYANWGAEGENTIYLIKGGVLENSFRSDDYTRYSIFGQFQYLATESNTPARRAAFEELKAKLKSLLF